MQGPHGRPSLQGRRNVRRQAPLQGRSVHGNAGGRQHVRRLERLHQRQLQLRRVRRLRDAGPELRGRTVRRTRRLCRQVGSGHRPLQRQEGNLQSVHPRPIRRGGVPSSPWRGAQLVDQVPRRIPVRRERWVRGRPRLPLGNVPRAMRFRPLWRFPGARQLHCQFAVRKQRLLAFEVCSSTLLPSWDLRKGWNHRQKRHRADLLRRRSMQEREVRRLVGRGGKAFLHHLMRALVGWF